MQTSTEDTDFINVTQNNFKKMSGKISKISYADGITDGRNSSFQKGFDEGYAEGIQIGFEFAKYKGLFAVAKEKQIDKNLIEEADIFDKEAHNKVMRINFLRNFPISSNILSKKK